jgi:hypothetical protein
MFEFGVLCSLWALVVFCDHECLRTIKLESDVRFLSKKIDGLDRDLKVLSEKMERMEGKWFNPN